MSSRRPALQPQTARPRSQARTRLARRAVIDAARDLFTERGYGATTVEAISELADVPPATVYRLFSSKHGILKSLLDVSIAGDDDDTAMVDRPQVRELLDEPEASTQLAGFVAIGASINARLGTMYAILVSAASSDTDAAALLDTLTRQRQEGQRVIARSLAAAGALHPDIRERDAADLIHAFMSPELYRLLVTDRGWSTTRYLRWLSATLVTQLLGDPTDVR